MPDWKTDTSLFEATVRDDPRSFLAWYNLAVERQEGGDIQGAMEAVDRCLSFRPRYLPARLTRATIFRGQGEPDRALEILRDAAEAAPPRGQMLCKIIVERAAAHHPVVCGPAPATADCSADRGLPELFGQTT